MGIAINILIKDLKEVYKVIKFLNLFVTYWHLFKSIDVENII